MRSWTQRNMESYMQNQGFISYLIWKACFNRHLSKILGRRVAKHEVTLWTFEPLDELRDWHRYCPKSAAEKFSQFYWE